MAKLWSYHPGEWQAEIREGKGHNRADLGDHMISDRFWTA